MFRNFSFIALITAGTLLAGEPAKVDTRKPATDSKPAPLIFTTATPADGGGGETAGSNVFVLPGSAAPAAVAAPPVAQPVASVRPAEPKLVEPEDKPPVLRRAPKLPEDFVKDAAVYIQRQMNFWTVADAKKLMGEALRHRAAVDAEKNEDGDIYAFTDPSSRYREFELDFDRENGRLRSIFVYPWNMKWEECRKLWGANVTASQAANGRRFYSYENRNLDVLVDKTGNVISFGLY